MKGKLLAIVASMVLAPAAAMAGDLVVPGAVPSVSVYTPPLVAPAPTYYSYPAVTYYSGGYTPDYLLTYSPYSSAPYCDSYFGGPNVLIGGGFGFGGYGHFGSFRGGGFGHFGGGHFGGGHFGGGRR
jgi:hypothetical protein